jgi:pyruvate formate lyase activating enzyme
MNNMDVVEPIIAEYWTLMENNGVLCQLCPHRCKIQENKAGICSVRENHGGILIATSYGQISSIALDPIEKKPLYMFKPGKMILSIGSYGCNLRCPFCQNSEISLEYENRRSNVKFLTPTDVVMLAKETECDGNIGIAYTYNEPFVGYDFMRDTAQLAHASGLCNIIVTNGYINEEPLEAILPVIDAMNIDLKSYSDDFYKKVGGDLQTVKNTIALSHKHCHIEVTMLVIPGENEDDVKELALWLSSIDREIPLHLSRFYPRYKYDNKIPTPKETLLNMRDIAKNYLKNVFLGNV